MILKAPAKVNLHLDIRGRRADGYHEILSVFQAVSLFDRIELRSLKRKSAVRVRLFPPIDGVENSVSAAVRRFRETSGIEAGLELTVHKAIPLGAGLGGGSSDAATTLLGLNRLFGSTLKDDQLRGLAAEIGSDVPFFLTGGAAVVAGRGERITPLAPRNDFELLLVYPDFPVLSAMAYQWLDQEVSAVATAWPVGPPEAELRRRYERRPVEEWCFFNSFEPVLVRRHRAIGALLERLRASGALAAGVSGSGSALFGVFSERPAAESAADRLRAMALSTWLLKPLPSGATAD